jgi:hypothetical protein
MLLSLEDLSSMDTSMMRATQITHLSNICYEQAETFAMQARAAELGRSALHGHEHDTLNLNHRFFELSINKMRHLLCRLVLLSLEDLSSMNTSMMRATQITHLSNNYYKRAETLNLQARAAELGRPVFNGHEHDALNRNHRSFKLSLN